MSKFDSWLNQRFLGEEEKKTTTRFPILTKEEKLKLYHILPPISTEIEADGYHNFAIGVPFQVLGYCNKPGCNDWACKRKNLSGWSWCKRCGNLCVRCSPEGNYDNDLCPLCTNFLTVTISILENKLSKDLVTLIVDNF